MDKSIYLFDFDFTLADATVGIVDSANYALSKLSFEPKDRDTIRKTVGLTLRESFSVLTGVKDETLAAKYVSFFAERADMVMTVNTVLFPDTVKSLEELKSRRLKTGIVTSKLHYRIDEVLKKFGIAGLIDCIVGFEDVETAKPSPEGLLKAISYFSVDKSKVLFIGDSLIDAKTAANASVDFAAVTTGTTEHLAFETLPNVLIAKNLTELLEKHF